MTHARSSSVLKFRRLFALLSFALLHAFALVPASEAQDDYSIAQTQESIEAIEFQIFVAGFQTQQSIEEAIRRLGNLKSHTLDCIQERESALNSTRATLGESLLKNLDEKSELSTEERRVKSQIENLRTDISECKLQLENIYHLDQRLGQLQNSLAKEKLRERKYNVLKNLEEGLPDFFRVLKQKAYYFISPAGIEREAFRPTLIFLLLVGFVIGFFLYRRKDLIDLSDASDHSYAIRIFLQCRHVMRRWAPFIVPAFVGFVYLWFGEGGLFRDSQLTKLTFLILVFLVWLIFIRAAIRWHSEYSRASSAGPLPVKSLYLRLIIVSTLVLIWSIIFRIPHVAGINTPPQQLLHNVVSTAVIVALIELLWFLPKYCKLPRIGTLARFIGIVLLAISLIEEWRGYQRLSEFIWSSVLFVAMSVTNFIYLSKLFRDIYDSLDSGKYEWQQTVRKSLAIEQDKHIPGLIWMRLLTISVLWIGLGLLILKSIGMSDNRIATIFDFLRDGIRFGDSQISVYNVLAGIFLFAVLLLAIRLIKDGLENNYLAKSHLDSGAKDAIVTITGYVGFTIAAIIGLSTAGLNFSNLAIIAGALSVGIGFGLQNIVNNFVSGIILLFERPIRPGDWIVTGTTEGYVKKISVRSTEVQTFNRSDVIVPNSDLIASEVTNWTLRDKHGRIIIPVGVAYGSDTELVKELLEKIPESIPEIIKGRAMLPVKVLFTEFGESALNFELRCYIYDIGYILDVKSKLHFAIDKMFREHNIEIAFPQRDIHIRSNESTNPVLE